MTVNEIVFFAIGLTGLSVLCVIVRQMGAALATCSDTGRAARAGALVIMTGLGAFGFGAVALIASMLPILTESGLNSLYAALGLCAVAFGFGFTYAAEALRTVVREAADRIAQRDAAAKADPAAETASA